MDGGTVGGKQVVLDGWIDGICIIDSGAILCEKRHMAIIMMKGE